MEIKAYITTEVFDRNSKLKFRRRRRSKSFVEAFLAILLAQAHPGTNQTGILDINDASQDLVDYAINFNMECTASYNHIGVVVGTGTTAVAVSDNKLETQIAEGTGSGQLTHSAVSFGALSVADPNISFTLRRDFLNLSGATITVAEEGIYAQCRESGGSQPSFCIIRDVESTGVEVADAENLRVTYTIQTST